MTTPDHSLTEHEFRLLKAPVDHARTCPADPDLEVRRVKYGFATNLIEYGEAIVADDEKASWESALRSLTTKGLLQQSSSSGQTWKYAIPPEAFAAVDP